MALFLFPPQHRRLGPCPAIASRRDARTSVNATLDIAGAWCDDRAHEDISPALLHMVERPDLRNAGLDVALWRTRRRGRVRQPLLPDPRRQDRPEPRLRAALGDLQRAGGSHDCSAVVARLAASHGRRAADAGQGRGAPVVEAAPPEYDWNSGRPPADRLDPGARAAAESHRRLQGLDAGALAPPKILCS